MAKALPRGVREKNGSYEARAVVNGIRINLYGTESSIAQCNARSIGAFKRMLRFCIRKPID